MGGFFGILGGVLRVIWDYLWVVLGDLEIIWE